MNQVTFTKYARNCSITNEGMNKGYLFDDGLMYFKYEKDLINHLRNVVYKEISYLKSDELLKKGYDEDLYYFTDWEEIDEDEFFDKEGNKYSTCSKCNKITKVDEEFSKCKY